MVELWANRLKKCNDNIINRVDVDFIKNNCTFGDVGQLNLAFRDFNNIWKTELGYTKNFSFKPGTVNIIKDIMTHTLFLQNEQKKAMKTIFNNYADRRWHMNRLRDDYNRLNDKLILMRNSGFQIVDFEREVVEIPAKFKEAMDNWNTTLAPLGAKVGIMNGQNRSADQVNDEYIHDSNLNLVYTVEIPNIILQVYSRDTDTSSKIGDIPMNGSVRIGWTQRLAQTLDNFGTIEQGRSIRNAYYSPLVYGEKVGMSKNIYHPFINARQDAHVCTGDLTHQLRDHFNNFRFVELTMLIHTWLTNFEHGRTYPLNPINRSFFGMPKVFGDDFANKVGQDIDMCSSRMLDEYTYYDTTAKECDNMECTLRDNCSGYQNYSDTIRQKEQREREERSGMAAEWIEDLCAQYEDDEGNFYVDEEMYEWLFETARHNGRDAVEMAMLSAMHDRLIREILNTFCKGGMNNNEWATPLCEWGDIYTALKMHPDYEIYPNTDSYVYNPFKPYDAFSFLNTLLVCNGVEDVQDFIIESLELYHAKVIELKPTEVSRKVDNGVSDDRIKREMEEWASAMGITPAEGRPITPERPIDEVFSAPTSVAMEETMRTVRDIVVEDHPTNDDGEPLF